MLASVGGPLFVLWILALASGHTLMQVNLRNVTSVNQATCTEWSWMFELTASMTARSVFIAFAVDNRECECSQIIHICFEDLRGSTATACHVNVNREQLHAK